MSLLPMLLAVTFSAAEHRHVLFSDKIYCFTSEARVCEQLAQSSYLTAKRCSAL